MGVPGVLAALVLLPHAASAIAMTMATATALLALPLRDLRTCLTYSPKGDIGPVWGPAERMTANVTVVTVIVPAQPK